MGKKVLAALAALVAATGVAATDVNKATLAELEQITGIGPSHSALIMSERRKGSFKDWNDLIGRVKGIGESSAKRFSDGGLTVNGAAYLASRGPSAASKASSPTQGAVETAASAPGAASAPKR